MTTFLIVYGILAVISFIGLEVISIIECREKNAMLIKDAYRTDHTKAILCAVFFPIVILIVLISAITESIIDRRKRP